MKIANLFRPRLTVAEGLRLPVQRHFYYSTFGVRGRHDNTALLSAFVCEDKPGTGFFVRNTESHSYRRFVSACRKKNEQNLLTLLLHKEPDFDKEYELVNKTFETVTDPIARNILSCYQNVLGMAKEEEELQRIVRALKDRIHEHPDKGLVSVMTHYKSSIASLERDVRSAQLNVGKTMSEEQQAEWAKVVENFHKLIDARRVWSVSLEDGSPSYTQVFFDLGVFDYIQSPGGTLVMRDHKGIRYYLYPSYIVAARSSVDFDVYQLKDIEMKFSVVDISTLAVRPHFNSHSRKSKRHVSHDALSTLYGTSNQQVMGEIIIPKLDLRFYVNRTGPAEDFIKAYDAYVKRKF